MTNEELVERIQSGINKTEYMGKLYIQNKGFIATVVRKYRYACQSGYNSIPIIEMDELMHEAYFGLIEAVEHFNPDQGNTFLTYAAHWINQAIKRFLENSGRVVRVPVHRQQEIYKYNQARAYYLSHYNREPSRDEYASRIGISLAGVDKLERFMFQGTTRSLDEMIPGSDNDNLSLGDMVPAEVSVEENAVEKLATEQIREDLWDTVAQVLKDDAMYKVIQYRFVECYTLDQIGSQIGISREVVRQYEAKALKRLRCNSRTKRIGEELGIWSREQHIDATRVKLWSMEGKLDFLDKREQRYAVNMGWIAP